jgi:uncharacterized membrane protein YdjX (TVP38/TMEM64 family)
VGAILLAVATTAAWVAVGPSFVPVLQSWLQGFGPYLDWGFVLLGSIAVAACAPASLLYVTGGMIFGLWRGVLLCSTAAAVGSALAFLLARSALGARMARMFARSARLNRFEQTLSSHGLWLVMLLRLSLFAPIGPVSYALGVMRISLTTFLLAMPAIVPSILVYVYAGHIARGLVHRGLERPPWEWAVLGVGFAATVLVTLWGGRAAQRALSTPRASEPGGAS